MIFNEIKIGDNYTTNNVVSESMVRDFAEITGDKNPIHLDKSYATKTIFKKRIAHGMLISSFISSILGMHFPGKGTIYLGQDIRFLSPVFIGDNISTYVEVVEKKLAKQVLILKTICSNDKGTKVIDGTAMVKCVI